MSVRKEFINLLYDEMAVNEDIVLNNIRTFALRLDRAERIGQS